MDLALNNLQRLICHKTQPNETKPKLNATYLNLKYFLTKLQEIFPLKY